jgi:hypothetical protein
LALARGRAETLGHTVGRAQAAHVQYSGGGAAPGGGIVPPGVQPGEPGGPVGGPRVPEPRICVLCQSTGHWYKAGAFEHADKMSITRQCYKVVGPGVAGGPKELCNKKHAFSGPLRTPCRAAGAPMPALGT